MSIVIRGSKPQEWIDISSDHKSGWINPYYAVVKAAGESTPLPIAVNNDSTEGLNWLRKWKENATKAEIQSTLSASLQAARGNNETIGRYHEMLGHN